MTTPTAMMTKLDAVNLMLASIGQSPINVLTGTIPKDAAKAVLALDTALREVLTQGWSFNSDTEYPLTPDGTQRIDVPATAIFIDPTFGEPFVMRWDTGGGSPALRLYDTDKRTFNEYQNDVKVDVIWLFNYEEIPQHARMYIAMKAGRKFQSGILASAIIYDFTKELEAEAYAGFRRLELRQQDFNINRFSVAAHRRRNPTRY